MKKIILSFFLLSQLTVVYSQQTTQSQKVDFYQLNRVFRWRMLNIFVNYFNMMKRCLCLFVICVCLGTMPLQISAQTKTSKASAFYGVHTGVGDFGSVTVHYNYWFEGWTIYAELTKITIGYYKNVQYTNDPAFQQALKNEGISLPVTLTSGYIADFNGSIQRSGCSLIENKDFKISNVASPNWTSVEPSQAIKDCADKYRKENPGRDFFLDKSKIMAGAGFTNIRFSDFKNKVERAEKNMISARSKAADNSRQFDSQIQRAQLLANEGNIAGAEDALRQAKAAAGNDQSLNTKLKSAESMVASRKSQQHQQQQQQAKAQSTSTSAGARTASASQSSTQNNTQGATTRPSSSTGNTTTGNTTSTTQSQETQQQMARIYQQMEDNRRKAEDLRVATDQTSREWASGNYIEGSRSLAYAYARQGNAAGAYGTVAAGTAMQIGSMIVEGKRKREAAAEASRAREAELEAERAEKARIEKRRVDMILSTRASVLDEYSRSKAIPLSTSKETANRIYYFIYDVNKSDSERERTTIYVSNVFEIGRFNDGTWPYQSAVDNEIKGLTPYGNMVLHGYYTSKEDAEQMRKLFVDQMKKYAGATITEVAYKGKPAAASMSQNNGKAASPSTTGAGQSSLGIPIGQGKTSKPATQSKPAGTQKTTGSAAGGSLGIPIKMKK